MTARLRAMIMPDERYLLVVDNVGRENGEQWKEQVRPVSDHFKDDTLLGLIVFSDPVEIDYTEIIDMAADLDSIATGRNIGIGKLE